MCIAGVWDVQTTSFEIPWFLGQWILRYVFQNHTHTHMNQDVQNKNYFSRQDFHIIFWWISTEDVFHTGWYFFITEAHWNGWREQAKVATTESWQTFGSHEFRVMNEVLEFFAGFDRWNITWPFWRIFGEICRVPIELLWEKSVKLAIDHQFLFSFPNPPHWMWMDHGAIYRPLLKNHPNPFLFRMEYLPHICLKV